MKPRKLLAHTVLSTVYERFVIGVPVRKLQRDFTIAITIPTLTRLLEWYEESLDQEQAVAITDTIENSLFPEWLDKHCTTIQSQPQTWKYIGKFPLGMWLEVDNEDN